jgi:hypothetical protein
LATGGPQGTNPRTGVRFRLFRFLHHIERGSL